MLLLFGRIWWQFMDFDRLILREQQFHSRFAHFQRGTDWRNHTVWNNCRWKLFRPCATTWPITPRRRENRSTCRIYWGRYRSWGVSHFRASSGSSTSSWRTWCRRHPWSRRCLSAACPSKPSRAVSPAHRTITFSDPCGCVIFVLIASFLVCITRSFTFFLRVTSRDTAGTFGSRRPNNILSRFAKDILKGLRRAGRARRAVTGRSYERPWTVTPREREC